MMAPMFIASVKTSPPKPNSSRKRPVIVSGDKLVGRSPLRPGTERWPIITPACSRNIGSIKISTYGTRSDDRRSASEGVVGNSRCESAVALP